LACVTNSTVASELDLTEFEAFLNKAMKLSDVPGVAVTIVRNDDVTLAKGYGYLSIEGNQSVDQDTLFAIGSNTKAFTATALGLLVQGGVISWDDRLIDLLPDFRTLDPYVNRELTIRDALSHRSGIEELEMAWYAFPELTREEVLKKIAGLPQSQSFRSGFLYNNYLYLAAGMVIQNQKSDELPTIQQALPQEYFLPPNPHYYHPVRKRQ